MLQRFTKIAFVVSLSVSATSAHMDPLGKIHPRVSRVGQTFHVYFVDPSSAKSASDLTTTYRRIYDKDGKLLEDRTAQAPKPEPLPEDTLPINLPMELRGVSRKFRDSHYVIPEYKRAHHGRPFYLVVENGSFIRRSLPWGELSIDVVHDFAVTDREMLILATRVQNEFPRENQSLELDFWLFHFDRLNGELRGKTRVGTPAFIYNFPRASNLLLENGVLYFVWNEQSPGGDQKLRLVTYHLQSKSFSDRPLPFSSTWNTTISIGIIGDVLCLAYHGVSRRISTEFLKINAL